eukprot:m.202454 g.202454  ORF g.202454 m.202454 type:complete len:464 (+) comp32829_c0_seq3:283-1674(+)
MSLTLIGVGGRVGGGVLRKVATSMPCAFQSNSRLLRGLSPKVGALIDSSSLNSSNRWQSTLASLDRELVEHALQLDAETSLSNPFHFEVLHKSTISNARVGKIHTPHGVIDTPTYVPVATNAVIKGADILSAEVDDADLIFCNTYHLLLQPGTEIIEGAGGLHKFTGRKKPIITDSGGFQVFSLQAGAMDLDSNAGLKGAGSKKRPSLVLGVDDDGVRFRSYIDGSVLHLTPESSVQAQKSFGADIIIPLDELLPYSATKEQEVKSFQRTHEWETRSLIEHLKDRRGQAMYSVVHGGVDVNLRSESLSYLSQLPFDGVAIGGSFGQNKSDLARMLDTLGPQLPHRHPIHLLGIGDMSSINAGVQVGIDTFDSCYPTRLGRHGSALAADGSVLDLRKVKFAKEFSRPLDESCDCCACRNHSVAYLRHLVKAKESAGGALLTLHNLRMMSMFMQRMREKILDNII